MKRIKYIVLFSAFGICSMAQSTLDNVLSQVLANNKTWVTEQQRLEATKVGFKTDNTLYNPEVSYDFMKGFPASAGNQNDLTVAQSFDFPTTYIYKREAIKLKTTQVGFEGEAIRRDILLEAKSVCLRLIYLNKRKADIAIRVRNAEKFNEDYQKKLEHQDATILDVNKARLQLITLKADEQILDASIAEYGQKLIALNGGKQIVFADTVYPVQPLLADFETVEKAVEAADPDKNFFETQQQIGSAQLKIAKSYWAPKMEAGYRYQGILGQQFHGVHVGLTLPLWENKNQVRYQKLQMQFYDSKLQEHRNEHYNETKELFDRLHSLRITFEDYQANFRAFSNTSLLNTALQAGQISSLEYFMELTLYYQGMDKYLELEYEYQKTIAELLKYRL